MTNTQNRTVTVTYRTASGAVDTMTTTEATLYALIAGITETGTAVVTGITLS
jgi:hypothetical protein